MQCLLGNKFGSLYFSATNLWAILWAIYSLIIVYPCVFTKGKALFSSVKLEKVVVNFCSISSSNMELACVNSWNMFSSRDCWKSLPNFFFITRIYKSDI